MLFNKKSSVPAKEIRRSEDAANRQTLGRGKWLPVVHSTHRGHGEVQVGIPGTVLVFCLERGTLTFDYETVAHTHALARDEQSPILPGLTPNLTGSRPAQSHNPRALTRHISA